MCVHRLLWLVLLSLGLGLAVSDSASAVEPRFNGSAELTAGAEAGGVSADGRFSLKASLQPDTSVQSSGRFGLSAKLQPDPKSIATACGPLPDQIFKNGFE